jgi:8-hydroxy-5-deazaflavin:NADPH oxidoreductase
MAKKIAILGRGHAGGALSQGLSRAGYEVIAVGKDERAIRDAAEWADVLIMALPFAAVGEVAQMIEPVTAGKPIVDVTNPLNEHADLAVGFTTSGGEELQKKLPRAHVVKALNTVFAGLMETGQVQGQPLTAFVAGDDEAARSTVMELARDIGFDAVNSGSLKNARLLEPLGVLNIQLGYFLGYGAQGGFRHLHAAAEVASGTRN